MQNKPWLRGRPHSINRLLLVSFLAIALVPVSFLGTKLYQAAWENAWREIHEKHRLLALNLGSPLRIYLETHQRMLGMLATTLAGQPADSERNAELLRQTLSQVPDFQALILMDDTDRARLIATQDGTLVRDSDAYASAATYIDTVMTEQAHVSGATFSALDGEPTLLLTQPLHEGSGQLAGVLMAELNVGLIDELRKRIEFGEGGHSVILDHRGHVIAHPNAEWMAEIRDLSSAPIVQAMMAGETGVTEFYSPWVGEQMVAGYTGVPDIGWGVMVPQPKSEVEQQVHALLFSQLAWAAAGLALAVLFAVWLARWITAPINRLAGSAHALVANRYEGSLPRFAQRIPLEVQQLDTALRDLVHGLQASRREVGELNKSLQQRVDQATEQLRETNRQLVEALQRADEFLSFARHDLRKPIAVITDVADSLNDRSLGDPLDERELAELLDLIKKSAVYMKDIVNDFLGRQAIEAGRITIVKSPADLNDIIRLMARSNRDYARRKGIEIVLDLDASLAETEFDVARISQVCQNLIDNAVKFCAEGDRVTVSTRALPGAIEVRVRDSGPGLTEQDLQKVFERNVKLSNRPTGGEVSTGLGLVLCRHIVELHEGAIGVENNADDRGCCFWFRLPVPAAARAAAARSATA